MRTLLIALLALFAGCSDASAAEQTLAEARAGHVTVVEKRNTGGDRLPRPPARLLSQVTFPAPVGNLAAYLSPSPRDGKRHPAIIWITGGDSNSIGDLWSPAPPAQDQTARSFRESGIVMMYPSLRGGNQNPGLREGGYGEVQDILAAADYLSTLDYVDPDRIYLGGHSTGGTLVLLTAEMTDRFRAVFAFGPVSRFQTRYGTFLGVLVTDQTELDLRSPGLWLDSLKSPTFVFEGAVNGNASQLQDMARQSTNSLAQFYLVPGADHFSVLTPTTTLLAKKILEDTGPQSSIAVTQDELDGLMAP